MPCVASDHQLYAFSPSEVIGDSLVSSAVIFSASGMREIMSATRTSIGSVALHHGCLAKLADALRHGLFSRAGVGGGTGCGTGAPLQV
jgi:hypothetical protein